jgi:hypothetical protein
MSKDGNVVAAVLGALSGGILTWLAVVSGRRRSDEALEVFFENHPQHRRRNSPESAKALLGDILVKKHRLIGQEQLAEALAHQRQADKKLGEILVEMGLITEDQLAAALYEQLLPPDPWTDAIG